ncbi:MAG TPA: PilZ domain-containing protein [Gemmataceae bacterium]|nr:PilZ domain-containing protein [Gemmataceae bacterium]
MAAEHTSSQANADTATQEQRAWPRSESARPLPRRIYLVDDFQPLDAWIVDVSQGGLTLLLARPLGAGTLLFIELESAPEAEPVKVWASIVRCAATSDTDWLLGCEFVNRLSEAELTAVLR